MSTRRSRKPIPREETLEEKKQRLPVRFVSEKTIPWKTRDRFRTDPHLRQLLLLGPPILFVIVSSLLTFAFPKLKMLLLVSLFTVPPAVIATALFAIRHGDFMYPTGWSGARIGRREDPILFWLIVGGMLGGGLATLAATVNLATQN